MSIQGSPPKIDTGLLIAVVAKQTKVLALADALAAAARALLALHGQEHECACLTCRSTRATLEAYERARRV